MYKRLFPNDHPAVARVLEKMSGLYEAREDYKPAERGLVEVLEMRKRLNSGDPVVENMFVARTHTIIDAS